MKIKLTKVYVNDQEKALRYYTDVLGLQKQDDFSNDGYRWLTVVSPDEPDGTQLQLELNSFPAARSFQEAVCGRATGGRAPLGRRAGGL